MTREVLYGRQAVREALRARRRTFYRLIFSEGLTPSPIIDEVRTLAAIQKVPVSTASKFELARITGADDHQGIALEASPYPYAEIQAMLDLATQRNEPPLLLLFDLVQDVRNLGALLRTAEAVGVHGVIIQEKRAAGITPAALNASSGAADHLLVAQVTNLAQEIERLKDADIWIAGLEGTAEAMAYTELKGTSRLAIVVGSEGRGIRRLIRERCDWLVSIPMRGHISSLNAAVAGSIVLYEILRQRRLR